MSFIDKVKVVAVAGAGGDGKRSFRQEKFVSKGGPDGGDGGHGGSIVLHASRNQNTLAAFRYQKELKASDGQGGGDNKKHGRNGKDLIVEVPVGTIATTLDGEVMADLTQDGERAIIAKGGQGGFGNAHFVSSRRQAPNFAEKGEPGDEFDLQLELKVIADVGLVGMPNAGKSTLLSKLSNARPEIADYPFTTLKPNLGVVDIDNESTVLIADIPGLIEGAAEGKGLGHDFLRHVERTAAILHLIDAYSEDVGAAYKTIRDELKAYKTDLSKRPEIIALTKVEGLDEEIVEDLANQLKRAAPKNSQIFAISSQSGFGLKPMLYAIKEVVAAERSKETVKVDENVLPVLKLTDTSDAYQVSKEGDVYVVTGERIERFARRTDFESEEGLQRLRDIMRRAGIMHELTRAGIEAGKTIRIGKQEFTY